MNDNTKAVVEALLFISDRPILIEQIKKVLDHLDVGQIRAIIDELKADYENNNRGMRIYEVAGGFQMIAAPDLGLFLKKLYKGANADRLSKPALETLAIVAYKQPITKLEIESLRNVDADAMMKGLLEKDLVRIIGRKDTPGRPRVYGTTRKFLECFGLKSLDELPKIDNIDKANLEHPDTEEVLNGPSEPAPEN